METKDIVLDVQRVVAERSSGVPRLGALSSHEGFDLLCVPSEPGDSDSSFEMAREWVESSSINPTLISLQGAQIVWGERRIAILTPPGRAKSVRLAVLEVASYQSQLRDIERRLGDVWAEMREDVPVAFELNKLEPGRAETLKKRFLEVLDLATLLSRLSPAIHRPHAYPPTLASQIHERARERLHLIERHGTLTEQVEGAHRLYEQCALRVSELKIAEKGHHYEKIIIGLLLLQVVHSFIVMH